MVELHTHTSTARTYEYVYNTPRSSLCHVPARCNWWIVFYVFIRLHVSSHLPELWPTLFISDNTDGIMPDSNRIHTSHIGQTHRQTKQNALRARNIQFLGKNTKKSNTRKLYILPAIHGSYVGFSWFIDLLSETRQFSYHDGVLMGMKNWQLLGKLPLKRGGRGYKTLLDIFKTLIMLIQIYFRP